MLVSNKSLKSSEASAPERIVASSIRSRSVFPVIFRMQWGNTGSGAEVVAVVDADHEYY